MKHILSILLVMLVSVSVFGCKSYQEYQQPLSIDIKENFETPSDNDDIDFRIQGITFTTGYAYNHHKVNYSDPGIEICLTIKNNKDGNIEPLMNEVMKRVRIFQRGVECDPTKTLLIHGELKDYSLDEKYILPGRSFNACLGYTLEDPNGKIEVTFFYKAPENTSKINNIIAEASFN